MEELKWNYKSTLSIYAHSFFSQQKTITCLIESELHAQTDKYDHIELTRSHSTNQPFSFMLTVSSPNKKRSHI
jgi:hypothetical protein